MATNQAKRTSRGEASAPGIPHDEISRIIRGEHNAPHGVLGAHPVVGGVVVRVFHPDATKADVLVGNEVHACEEVDGGLFSVVIEGAS